MSEPHTQPPPSGADISEPSTQWDHAIERVVIGACLNDPTIVGDINNMLTADAWHDPRHATIWQAIRQHWMDGHDGGPVAIAHQLARHHEPGRVSDFVRVGGGPYLATCCEAGTVGNPGWYVEQVNRLALIRRLHEATTRAHHITASPNGHAIPELADKITTIIADATDIDATRHHTSAHVRDIIEPTLAAIDAIASGGDPAIPTGIADLDTMLGGGLRQGQLVIIAGRPGMGKSTLATNILVNAATAGHPGFCASLEMSNEQLMMRILSDRCRIPLHNIRTGALTDEQWAHLARRSADIAELPLVVDENKTVTVASLRTILTRQAARDGTQLAVVDYIGLMTAIDTGKRNTTRQEEVAALSRGLKLLGGELSIPIIAVAQLNRGPEQRADKTPQLSDLRESGALENDADVVIFVHRPEYYDSDSPRRGEADLIVAKQRDGQVGTVTVASQLHYSRFADMAIS